MLTPPQGSLPSLRACLFSGCPSAVTFHPCCSVELLCTSFLQGVWLLYLPSHEHSPIPSGPLCPLTQPRGVRERAGHTGADVRKGRFGIPDSSPGVACSWLTQVCSVEHLAQGLGPVACLFLSLVHLSRFLHTSALPLLSIMDFRSLYALLPPCRPSLRPSSFPCEKDCVIFHIS